MNILDKAKCGLCGASVEKFKINSGFGLHKACICLITESEEGKPGFLEVLCNECLEKIKNGEVLKIPSIDEILPNGKKS